MKAVPIPNVCLNILKQSVNTKREQTSKDILHSFNGVSVLGLGIGYPRKSSLSSCVLTQEAVITPVAQIEMAERGDLPGSVRTLQNPMPNNKTMKTKPMNRAPTT